MRGIIFYKNKTHAHKVTCRYTGICFIVMLLNLFPFTVQGFDKIIKQNDAHCIVEFEGGIMDWTTGVVQVEGRPDGRKVISEPVSDTISDPVSDRNSLPLPGSSLKLLHEKALFNARKHMVKIFESIAAGQERRIPENGYSIHMLKAEMEKKALDAEIIAFQLPANGPEQQTNGAEHWAGVALKNDIYGDFLQLILPPELRQIPDIEVIEPENKYKKGKKYTGMVIDARDIGFKPIIYPVIVSEQGKEIYGALSASREYAIEKGLCNYAYIPEPDVILRRAGENPVRVKGLRKEGDNNDTIVITIADADKISKMPERHQFMKACKVIILVSKLF